MIHIEFLDGQGLGNQLWMYASAKGIAKKLGYGLTIHAMQKFKGASFLKLEAEHQYLGTEHLSPTHNQFFEKQFFDRELGYFATDFDPEVLNLPQNSYLSGLFQSEKYFFGQKPLLAEWLVLSDAWKDAAVKYCDATVLNIRGGEYKRFKNLILPKSYWQQGMKNITAMTGNDQFVVVTDDVNYARALFPELPTVSGNVAECYAAVYGAKQLVVSNSSFAYFPICTRLDKPLVIAPYQWSRFNNPFGRWAAPCNVTTDWVWQKPDGAIANSAEIFANVRQTTLYYQLVYKTCTDSRSGINQSWRVKVPEPFRKTAKRILAKLLPKYIG